MKGTVTLIFSRRSKEGASISSIGPPGDATPALLKSKSTRPNAEMAASKRASGAPGSVKSPATLSGFGEVSTAAAIIFSVSASWSALLPESTQAHPAAERAMAVARPIPEEAPVTIAMPGVMKASGCGPEADALLAIVLRRG